MTLFPEITDWYSVTARDPLVSFERLGIRSNSDLVPGNIILSGPTPNADEAKLLNTQFGINRERIAIIDASMAITEEMLSSGEWRIIKSKIPTETLLTLVTRLNGSEIRSKIAGKTEMRKGSLVYLKPTDPNITSAELRQKYLDYVKHDRNYSPKQLDEIDSRFTYTSNEEASQIHSKRREVMLRYAGTIIADKLPLTLAPGSDYPISGMNIIDHCGPCEEPDPENFKAILTDYKKMLEPGGKIFLASTKPTLGINTIREIFPSHDFDLSDIPGIPESRFTVTGNIISAISAGV